MHTHRQRDQQIVRQGNRPTETTTKTDKETLADKETDIQTDKGQCRGLQTMYLVEGPGPEGGRKGSAGD